MLDLTEKNLNKNIFKLSIPVAIENLLHMSVFIIDAVMVGRLGTDAIAAVGLAGALSFTITMIFSSVNAGSASIVARHIGAKEKGQAQVVGAQAIFMALAMGIIITPLFLLYANNMLILMSAEPRVSDLGKGYLQIVGGFVVFRLIILACNGILRGAGDTKTPMKVTLIINCINILLNWLLIFGVGPFPKWGVAGAAWATAIAYIIGTVLLCTKLFTGRCVLHISIRQTIHVHFESLKRIVRISIPAAIDAFLTQMGFLFFTKIVTILGTVSLAAHQIAIRIESISFMPGFALAVSTATLVGQSLGAKNANLALLSMRRSCYFALSLMGFFALIFLIFPAQMAMLFKPESSVLSLAMACVMIAAIEQPALAIYMVYSGGLRGAGDTISPMIITIVGTLCFHVPVSYVFGITLGWGLPGVWFGSALDWICRAIAIYILYRRGRWRRVTV
ncbi:MAG TPA: MATE family efflux transporter [Candidatus Wunengus sp. YC60]|uniref:MATE family efflux transporter n=1 Tax=Candidatus Wunengus sp. YC60 TaxID=3367697 RepID=UPI004028F6E3